MSVRLTKEIRENILNSVITKAFDPKKKLLLEEQRKLGDEIAKHLYGVYYNCNFPEAFTNKIQGLDFFILGERHSILCNEVTVPINRSCYSDAFRKNFLLGDKVLIEKVRKMEKALNDYSDAKKEAVQQTSAILNSVTTTNKLLELWPEIEPVMIKHLPVIRGSGQLAIRTDVLSKTLGL